MPDHAKQIQNVPIRKIYIEPTSECNLLCKMCSRNAWFGERTGHMTWQTFERVLFAVRESPTVDTLFFGGVAEPFSHPRLFDMLRAAKATGRRVELITNGAFLNRDVIQELFQLELDMLWVSLDGGDAETHQNIRPDSDYKKVTDQLLQFSLARIRGGYQTKLGLAFVAMKSNIHQLPKVIELANLLHAAELKVTNVLPYSKEMADEILYRKRLYDMCYNEKLMDAQSDQCPVVQLPIMDFDQEEVSKTIPEIFKYARLLQIGDNQIIRQGDRCKFVEAGATFVRWDGELSPCLSLLHNHIEYLPETERKIAHCSFGNVNQRSIMEIWTSQNYAEFRERIRTFAFPHCTICGHCTYMEGNHEDCVGNPFPTCGGCLWAEGLIQCP
jgi:MoaA/NifB/PqqE/SkfB family radical SAM enzyme